MSAPQPQGEPVSDLEPLNENLLPDDYPIYGDYLYVADGKVYRSDWHGINVRTLKLREGFKEVRRCDISGRAALTPPRQGEG